MDWGWLDALAADDGPPSAPTAEAHVEAPVAAEPELTLWDSFDDGLQDNLFAAEPAGLPTSHGPLAPAFWTPPDSAGPSKTVRGRPLGTTTMEMTRRRLVQRVEAATTEKPEIASSAAEQGEQEPVNP